MVQGLAALRCPPSCMEGWSTLVRTDAGLVKRSHHLAPCMLPPNLAPVRSLTTHIPRRAENKQIDLSHHRTRSSISTRSFQTCAIGKQKLQVQEDRMYASLHDTCKWGSTKPFGDGPTDTGMRRLSLDDNDAKARAWFVEETRALGCSKHIVDELGNIFAIRPGKRDGPATAMGSHLDTQPGPGGRYDGILGIHAGIEALRVLKDHNVETHYPICVVNWTNEEGARFPRSVMASSVWAGLLSTQDAWAIKEVPSLATGGSEAELKTVKDELARTGWLGKTACDYREVPLGAHFELHIEQGPILEREKKKIGVVVGGQAYRWYTVVIGGREAHTGSTPFTHRADALQAAARIVIASKKKATEKDGLCSTGVLSLQPGSTNTIPGKVSMSLDIRHPDHATVVEISEAVQKVAEDVAREEGSCSLKWVLDSDSAAPAFDQGCIQAVRDSATEVVGKDKWLEVRSGAGHDSFATSTRCPTTMVFVPSRDGISHNQREFTSKEDCAIGAQVLLGAVLRYDALRAGRTSKPSVSLSSSQRGLHTSVRPSLSNLFSTRPQRTFTSTSCMGKKDDDPQAATSSSTKGDQDRLPERQRDDRPFSKKYPPPKKQPDTVVFDQPAIANPLETAEAHARFRKRAKIAVSLLTGVLGIGALAYWGIGVVHADDGGVRGFITDKPFNVKGLELPHEEMEKRISEAQRGQGNGNYAVLAVKRSTTIAKAVALCVWDYRQTLNKKYPDRKEEQEALRLCHLRSAHRILVALQENGGLYIKLGQHISSVILLPPEWTNTMKPLQDQNTPTPLPELEAMFRSETGWTFAEAFSEIDAKAIGVASLAQVHRAVDRRTGQPLAIKLMHPEVERFSEVDMQTVNVLVRWVKRVFPQFEFTWLAEEMNQNMPLEMDFRHEAENARRADSDFAGYRKTSVYIPKVPWVFKRAMAMEFIDGRRPDDLAYLAKHDIDRNRVSQELSRVFAQMVYLHGFFHADPHGGNVLVRPAPKGSRSLYNFEVVLLDHGLYFDIDEELRSNYARFWLSLLSPSTPKVSAERRKYAKLIANIDDDLYPILESAITGRSGLEGSDPENPSGVKGKSRASSILDIDSGGVSLSEEEQEHIRKTVMEKEGLFLSILDLLRRLPRRMLMVLKLNDLTRSLDASLHTTHGQTRPFIIAARYCALAVWKDDCKTLFARRRSIRLFSLDSLRLVRDYVSSWYRYLWFYRGLSLLEALSDINAQRRKFFSFSQAFAKCASITRARRASQGLISQEERQKKESQEQERARQEVARERQQG